MLNREGSSPVKTLFFGILAKVTGYLISVSSSLPSELRYQKMNERKRKKVKTRTLLLITPLPFFRRL
jgi:hypothetical protein